MKKKVLLISPFFNLKRKDTGGKDILTLKIIDFYLEENYEIFIFPIKETVLKKTTWFYKENTIKIFPNRGFKFSISGILKFFLNFNLTKGYLASFLNGEQAKFLESLENDFTIIHSLYTISNYNRFLINFVDGSTKKISHYHHGRSSNYEKNDLNIFDSEYERKKQKIEKQSVVIYPTVEHQENKNEEFLIKEEFYIFLARVDKRKRLLLLLDAIKNIKKEFNSKLFVIGDSLDKKYYGTCKQFSVENNLNVEFTGLVSSQDKNKYLSSKNCKGIFLPSEEEAFGIAYVEGFLKGLRCIGFDGVINEFNTIFNEPLGIPFEGKNNDSKDLSECIINFQKNYLNPIPTDKILEIRKRFSNNIFRDNLRKEIISLINK